MSSRKTVRAVGLALWTVPLLAFAEVGKVAIVEGVATRAPKGGAAQKLAAGTLVELGDVLAVKSGNLKVVLNDESVLMLAPGSRLEIEEAVFAGQERKSFSAKLWLGKLWTKVSKAVGGSKFEVTTERAVAGVRGTIFRVDAQTLVKAANGGRARKATIVRVQEGRVGVKPSAMVAQASGKAPPPKKTPKGERKEIPPPFEEISADAWEKKFEELQQNRQIAVGVDLWELAEYEEAAKQDAFSRWVEANQ